MLCSFRTDIIPCKVKRCQCLCKMTMTKKQSDAEKSRLTVFTCNAHAKYFAPLAPIWLASRWSVMSVCVRWTYKKSVGMVKCRVSLYSLLMHLPNAVLLQRAYCCWKDQVLLVSVWDEGTWELTRCRKVTSHCVCLQCLCQILSSFSEYIVAGKMKRWECLCEMKIAQDSEIFWSNVSLYSLAMHLPNAVHLHHW
jgi:hypothetical protein